MQKQERSSGSGSEISSMATTKAGSTAAVASRSLAADASVRQCLSSIREDGFAIVDQFLSRSKLLKLRREVDMILSSRDPECEEQWLLQIHQLLPRANNWMWELATAPFVVSVVSSFLGPRPLLYCSQISDKSAIGSRLRRKRETEGSKASRKRKRSWSGEGGDEPFQQAVPWHQDGDSKVLTLWLPLDDVDEHNGGLRVLRGAHVLGRLPWRPVGSSQELKRAEALARHNVFEVDLASVEVVVGEDKRESNRTSKGGVGGGGGNTSSRGAGIATTTYTPYQYTMKAGGLAMHHPLLPHSSPANTSTSRRRRVIILRFHAAGEKQVLGRVRDFRDPRRCFVREVMPVAVGATPPEPATARPTLREGLTKEATKKKKKKKKKNKL